MLNANQTGSYQSIGIIMLISAIVPFVFLSKPGRKQIGIISSRRIGNMAIALAVGILCSLLMHYIGQGIYGNSYQNWYVYIGDSYGIPEDISVADKKVMFIIMAITSMTFSPLGEEFFFRGIVHGSFAASVGAKKASIIDSAAFALTHVSHFGLVFVNHSWDFYLGPALIWVTAMFLVSILFFKMKQLTGSIWGAVLCHSGFNLGMTYCIFYLL